MTRVQNLLWGWLQARKGFWFWTEMSSMTCFFLFKRSSKLPQHPSGELLPPLFLTFCQLRCFSDQLIRRYVSRCSHKLSLLVRVVFGVSTSQHSYVWDMFLTLNSTLPPLIWQVTLLGTADTTWTPRLSLSTVMWLLTTTTNFYKRGISSLNFSDGFILRKLSLQRKNEHGYENR